MHQVFLKNGLVNLKYDDVDKLDVDNFKNVPSNLSNLKSKVDKLDIRKLETTPVDEITDAVKNGVAKKSEYNESVKKVNNINTDTSNLFLKLTITQKLMKLIRNLLLTMIIIIYYCSII